MEAPLVSSIICVRNGEAYIAAALDSICAQGLSGVETVVVLDGSSDRSGDIARVHPARPTIIAQGPSGLPAAMNTGMQNARGRFIAFLDSDDVWPPDRLARLLDAVASNPDSDGVYGRLVNTDARLVPIRRPEATRMVTAMLIRRTAAETVGAFRTDVKHGANIDWAARATQLGLKFVAIEAVVTLRRIHGGNMGILDRPQARGDLLRVIRDHHLRTHR